MTECDCRKQFNESRLAHDPSCATRNSCPPTKVKVGFMPYIIENWNRHSADANSSYGEHSAREKTIRIDFGHGANKNAHTLLHELLHAVYYVWHIDDEDGEERTVSALSNGLATVFRDNPDVASWIVENLKGDG